MLGKLFKYDMRALSRILVPLHAAVLVLAVLACVCGFMGYSLDAAGYSSEAVDALMVTISVTFLFSLFGMGAVVVATFVVIIHRFYRNLFTDEGYLTLTLPVTANQVMLSKVLAGLLWLLIDAVVVSVCSVLAGIVAAGFTDASLESTMPYWLMRVASGDLLGTNGWASVLVGAVSTALQGTMGLLMAYAAFTLGATAASRHKVAAGIGMYVLLSWAVGLLASITVVSGAVLLSSGSAAASSSTASMVWSVAGWVGAVVVSAACYALSVYLLGRKVNLS